MSIDLEQLSFDELAKLQKNAADLIKSRRKQEIKNAYVQFQQTAKSLGVTVDEIMKVGKGVKTKRPAKYQNPNDKKQTWSGQGRTPQWLADELDKGKTLESFLIN